MNQGTLARPPGSTLPVPVRSRDDLSLANPKDRTVTALKFLLADQDRQRSAAIGAALARFRGVTVANGPEGLTGPASDRRIVLAADEPGAIERIIERIHATGIRAKVIAYSEEPSQHRMVKAMAAGAVDYLHWPCDPAEIVAAANAATADLQA